MVLKIAIGITTYSDISSKEFAAKVYDAYSEASPKLLPDQIRIMLPPQKYDVKNREDFTLHWCTNVPLFSREKYRRGPMEKTGNLMIGAEWRKRGTLAGMGEVNFRPEIDPAGSNTISISHNYSPNIDWQKFFLRLCDISNPSYGMIHLFDKGERERNASLDWLEKFDGPVAGEKIFTSWKSALGYWRKPDQWQLKERRSYRYLPQLSWGNFLGPEFDGQYNKLKIQEKAELFDHIGGGFFFTTTHSIDDIRKKREQFEDRRLLLRDCFQPGFFRS